MTTELIPPRSRRVKGLETEGSPLVAVKMTPKVIEHYNDVLERAAKRGVTRTVEMMRIDPVDIGRLFNVNPEWQRVRRLSHVQQIGYGLNKHGFTSPIILSRKTDGTYDVIDGCHRLTAVQHTGKMVQVAAEIYHGLTSYETRELFRCLSNAARLNTGDFLRSYAAESPAFKRYGSGRNEECVLGLGFKSVNRGRKVIEEVSYDNLLAAWYGWKKRRTTSGKERAALLAVWRSEDGISAMETMMPLLASMQIAELTHPLFYGAMSLRAMLEIIEASSFERFDRALWKVPHHLTPEGYEAMRHQSSGGLIEIRRYLLQALNHKVAAEKQCVLPLWVLQRGA